MSALVLTNYNGMQVTFTDDGWFDATAVAKHQGREVSEFLALSSTREYIAALDANAGKNGIWKRTRRGHGGGTWLHPKLGVLFARWLSADFAVWCDSQIDKLLHGNPGDWRKLRHEAASSFKVANAMLKMVRAEAGKDTERHHYSNEARLVNWSVSGEFKGLDRDALSADDLALLAYLEERNAVLIGRGIAYEQRKPMLSQYAKDWRMARAMPALAGPIAEGC